MSGLLKGQRCVITGGSRGIGRAIALAYSKEQGQVVLVGRVSAALKAAGEECSKAGAESVETFETDLINSKEVDKLVEEVLAKRVDVLVNCAGGGSGGPGNALGLNPDLVDKMIQLNLSTPIRLIRGIAPSMVERKHGTIVNIGSVAALEGMSGAAGYAASKWGLRGFHMSCYEEMRRSNIKNLLINPAFVKTDLVMNVSGVNHDRMILPDDVAEVALLPFKTSSCCCPAEVTLRLTLDAWKFD
eukprot:Platyproteum_vivax@DN2321_c0_g1_i1.p1